MSEPSVQLRDEEEVSTADMAAAAQQPASDAEHRKDPGAPANAPVGAGGSPGGVERPTASIFTDADTQAFRSRWDAIQTAFVDDPRRAVQEADQLVAATIKRLAEVFARERTRLEQQWDRGDDVSTEDLRLALQRYRSFFARLLSIGQTPRRSVGDEA